MKTTNKLEVMVVDDDRTYNNALVNYLQGHLGGNATVTGFQTGEECVGQIDKKPQVVILDYFLNSQYFDAMNGISILDIIKKKNPNVEIVMVSGQNKLELAVSAMRHGAFNYVIKEESAFPQINKSVRNIMHMYKLRNDLKSIRKSAIAAIAGVIFIIGFTIAIEIFAPGILNH